MFEEEYFFPIVPRSQETGGNPLVYKYFTEISEEDMAFYQNGEASGSPIERGNMLASSLVHL